MPFKNKKDIEGVAMNIVYQLDDDANLSVGFRQANNDKRIDFVENLLLTSSIADIAAMLEFLENWQYRYDNYVTMMATKASFQKGQIARELASDFISYLQTCRDNLK